MMIQKKRMTARVFSLIRKSQLVLRAGFLLSLVLPSTAMAHEQKTAVTRIFFNPATNNIEVMHRFLVHDAEHAAQQIFGAGQSLLESDQSRELFSSYVMNRFSMEAELSDGESNLLTLDYIGSEIDGQFIWVYQETPIIEGISGFGLVHMALRDVWPDQSNLINVDKQGQTLSVVFDDGAEFNFIRLP